jgi:uncharacterized protein affecting Mg2+/Co2+ transport
VAHKAVDAHHYWQYGYSLTFQNTAQEPLQLLKKAWTVQDISGAQTSYARAHKQHTNLTPDKLRRIAPCVLVMSACSRVLEQANDNKHTSKLLRPGNRLSLLRGWAHDHVCAQLACATAGSSRRRESSGIFGLQPIIEPSSSLSCKTAITLSSIKVSHRACAGHAT